MRSSVALFLALVVAMVVGLVLIWTSSAGAATPGLNGNVIYALVKVGMPASAVGNMIGPADGPMQAFKSPVGPVDCFPFDVPTDVAVCFATGKGRWFHRVVAVLKIDPTTHNITAAKTAWAQAKPKKKGIAE